MPQPILHIRIAHGTLDRWRTHPSLAPVPTDEPGVVDGFLQGALAPDMGLFPGGLREISRLAHTVRTGALVRALHAHASTPVERAFAWGWLTHVLADAEIHPLVNAHADLLLAEEGVAAPDRRQRGIAHVRVELGLDVWHLADDPAVRGVRVRRVLDEARTAFLHDALIATYGRTFPTSSLLRSHRAVTRFWRPYVLLAQLMVADFAGDRRGILRLTHVRRVGRRLLRPSSQAAGFLAPVPASPALVARTDAALGRIEHALDAHIEQDLRHLADVDLETGQPLEPHTTPAAA